MSLFAFQDVITAVTGILLILVLVLAVEVSQRVTARPSEAAEVSGTDWQTLQDRLARARIQLQVVRFEIDQWNVMFGNLASTSPAACRQMITTAERQNQQLREKLHQLQQQVQAEREQLDQLEARQQQMGDTGAAQRAAVELERLKKETAELRRRWRELKSSDRTVYTMPRGFRKDGWLAVVSDWQIQAAPLGRAARPRRFRVGEFLRFLTAPQRRGSVYVFLLVRPDGINTFDALEQALRDRGIAYGYDAIGPTQEVLDRETGAGVL